MTTPGARERATPFAKLLAAINRLAHEVDLSLDVAVDLFAALDDYTKQRVADATAAEKARADSLRDEVERLRAEIDRLRAELDEATGR